jgi:Spy/CpxP family protein refolding chaperone
MKNYRLALAAKLLIVLSIVIASCVTVFAAPIDQATITPDQKAAIQAVIRQANEQVREVKAGHASSPREFKNEYRKIHSIRTNALKKIQENLTPEQQTYIQQLLSGAQSKKEERKEFLESLDLTRQQKVQVAKILGQAQDAAWNVTGNSALDFPEIGKQTRQIFREAMHDIRDQLTTDQQAKLDAWQQ